MSRTKKERPRRTPLKSKLFVVRIFAVVIIVAASFWAKQYTPSVSSYVKNQISYNINFDSLAKTSKEFIKNHSTFFHQAEN